MNKYLEIYHNVRGYRNIEKWEYPKIIQLALGRELLNGQLITLEQLTESLFCKWMNMGLAYPDYHAIRNDEDCKKWNYAIINRKEDVEKLSNSFEECVEIVSGHVIRGNAHSYYGSELAILEQFRIK